LETEIGFSNTKIAGESTKTSDTVLATMEFHIDAQLNDMVKGHVMLLHEEDDTPLEVDEGTITIGRDQGLSLTMGQMYLPFGTFETNMVADPLTLELGEIRESAIMATYVSGDISGSVYLFNGNIHNSDSSKLEQKGLSVVYEKDALHVGLDYISSIVDTNGLEGIMANTDVLTVDEMPYLNIDKYVPGTALHLKYTTDAFNIIVERVAAMKKFALSDGESALGANDGVLADMKPVTTNVEFGYNIDDATIAIAIQGSKDAENIFPKKKVMLGYSRSIFEKVGLGLELAKTTDYDEENTDTTFTTHLAVEF